MTQLATPAEPPMPSFAQLSGLKEAHMAFRDFLRPHVAAAIASSLQEKLFRPVGKDPFLDGVRQELVVMALVHEDDPTDGERTENRARADAEIAAMLAEGPGGAIHRKIEAGAADLVADVLKAAWIQAHHKDAEPAGPVFAETFFTEPAFGRLAGIWREGPRNHAASIPVRHACSLIQGIDAFLRARAALPADQAFPPGGKKLLEFAAAG